MVSFTDRITISQCFLNLNLLGWGERVPALLWWDMTIKDRAQKANLGYTREYIPQLLHNKHAFHNWHTIYRWCW